MRISVAGIQPPSLLCPSFATSRTCLRGGRRRTAAAGRRGVGAAARPGRQAVPPLLASMLPPPPHLRLSPQWPARPPQRLGALDAGMQQSNSAHSALPPPKACRHDPCHAPDRRHEAVAAVWSCRARNGPAGLETWQVCPCHRLGWPAGGVPQRHAHRRETTRPQRLAHGHRHLEALRVQAGQSAAPPKVSFVTITLTSACSHLPSIMSSTMNAIRRLVSAYELKPASPSTLPHRTASFDPPSEGLLLCGA
eukprot:SAG22_NODE_5156_length_1074_cov_24.019487_1_plen_251_part_00